MYQPSDEKHKNLKNYLVRRISAKKPILLTKVAVKFNVDHSYVLRIIKKLGLYEKYKGIREDMKKIIFENIETGQKMEFKDLNEAAKQSGYSKAYLVDKLVDKKSLGKFRVYRKGRKEMKNIR